MNGGRESGRPALGCSAIDDDDDDRSNFALRTNF
jgi:hypothetical protein